MRNYRKQQGQALVIAAVAIALAAAAPARAITITPTFDSTITSDPNAATIESTINAAIGVYEQNFSDPINVTITFQEETTGLGNSNFYFTTVSYSDYLAALENSASDATDTTALAHLPAGPDNPVNGSRHVNLQDANARALGFSVSPPAGQTDGTISLNTSTMNLSRGSIDPTKYDLMATTMHEIDEVLGIASALTGLQNGSPAPTGAIWPLDLFRYAANGSRSFDTGAGTSAFFSLDGTTDLVQFNQHAPGDYNDWFSYPSGGNPPRVQDAYATPGATPNLGVELTALDAIGFHFIPVQGDVNHDGVVNGLDIALVASNWLATGSNPADANNDGVVNGLDISLIASNWLRTDGGAGGGSGSGAAVPEPSTAMLALIAAIGSARVWAKRRRREP
jgi:hypothetical protein